LERLDIIIDGENIQEETTKYTFTQPVIEKLFERSRREKKN